MFCPPLLASQRRLTLTLGFAALLALPVPAGASAPRVVAVLYFDNNTPQRDYDLLQKGLADMLITDLSSVPTLQVVEREKLQKLLDELKLQRSRYFDPATAQRLGKGVGAELAVTGALTSFEPQLRIDVRLIEVATSKVLLADKVVGPKDRFFELQQELVDRFIAGLALKGEKRSSRTGAIDLTSAVKYSRGLDAADKGDLKGASSQLAEVVREAPTFALGKERYAELLRRLRAAGQKRDRALSAEEQALLADLDAAVKKDVRALEAYALEAYFCHRVMRGNAALWQLSRGLDGNGLPEDYRFSASGSSETAALLKRFAENQLQLVADSKAKRDTHSYSNHSVSCPMALYQVGSQDFHRARKLGLPFKAHANLHPTELLVDLVELAVFGEYRSTREGQWTDGSDLELKVVPTLAQLDPSWGKRSLELLEEAKRELAPEAPRDKALLTARVLDLKARVLLRQARREEAIAQWQGYLEANPTSKYFKAFEAQIERLLGVSEAARQAEQALRSCAGAEEHLALEVERVLDAEGARGLRRLWEQVESGCPNLAPQLYLASAGGAALRGDCPLLTEALAAAKKKGREPQAPLFALCGRPR